MQRLAVLALVSGIAAFANLGCGSSAPAGGTGSGGSSAQGGSAQTGSGGSGGSSAQGGSTQTGSGGASSGTGGAAGIGNTGGPCTVPSADAAVDASHPTTVVGDGTAASCTAAKVVSAVAGGGVVTFNCGSDPLTIVVPEIEIINDGGVTKDGSVTIDGGGKITLSGGGKNRILRQDACNSNLHYTTTHCNNQNTPHLVLQNIGFTAGLGLAKEPAAEPDALYGGGAIYVAGGTFKAINITVTSSQQTNASGQNVQDLAGGAIYAFEIYSASGGAGNVSIVNSTFDGNSGINGGALGSIGISWTIINSVFKNNSAIGHGENPARTGTEGGGLGGAIYNDGDNLTLSICGSQFLDNQANELGSGAIIEVDDARAGNLIIDQSTFTGNSTTGDVEQSDHHPGIFVEAQDDVGVKGVTVTNTTFN